MSNTVSMSLVRCDGGREGHAEIVSIEVEQSEIEKRLIERAEEDLHAGRFRSLHLAADHETHGPVTYLQHITRGEFYVYVGDPDALDEHVFRPGDWVGFNDNRGIGHASKVGPDGCSRTFHLLKGQLG